MIQAEPLASSTQMKSASHDHPQPRRPRHRTAVKADELDGVDQTVQRSDLALRQHEQDRENRDAVHQRLGDARAQDRNRDVAAGIDHLLPSRRR